MKLFMYATSAAMDGGFETESGVFMRAALMKRAVIAVFRFETQSGAFMRAALMNDVS